MVHTRPLSLQYLLEGRGEDTHVIMTNNSGRVSTSYMAWGVGCLHVGVSPPVPPQPSLTLSTPTLPACNVTIHNRCKDTLANCTKVKQKVS